MNVRFSLRALHELSAIADYLDERNPDGAWNVRRAIYDTIAMLERSPRMGRKQIGGKVRKLVVARYPYLIYYTLDDRTNAVTIADIRHAARKRRHRDA